MTDRALALEIQAERGGGTATIHRALTPQATTTSWTARSAAAVGASRSCTTDYAAGGWPEVIDRSGMLDVTCKAGET